MTIQEAIRSGLQFKRPKHTHWNWISSFDPKIALGLYELEDILAEDWVVDEYKIALAADQIIEAMNEAFSAVRTNDHASYVATLLKKLGFKS